MKVNRRLRNVKGGEIYEKTWKKVKLDKKSLQAYAFCVCTNCPCPSGTNSYTAKYNDSERKAK